MWKLKFKAMGYEEKKNESMRLAEPEVSVYTTSKNRKRNRKTQHSEYEPEFLSIESEKSRRELEGLIRLYKEGSPGARENLLSALEKRIRRASTPESIKRTLILSEAQMKARKYYTAEEAEEESRRFLEWLANIEIKNRMEDSGKERTYVRKNSVL